MGRPKGKFRTCLKCNKPFWSRGPENRICAPCKKENEKIVEFPVYKVPVEGR